MARNKFKSDFGLLILMLASLLVIPLTSSSASDFAGATEVVILNGNTSAPYKEVEAGFRRHLGNVNSRIEISTVTADNFAETPWNATAPNRGGSKPPVILAVGSKATKIALQMKPSLPVVSTLIMTADLLDEADNATGVTLSFPARTSLEWMKRIVPAAKTVGILHSSAQNDLTIEQTARTASLMGLRLLAEEIHSPQDLPTALTTISRRADILWGLPDSGVFSPDTGREVMLFCFENHLPFAGLSASWVKAGALYALDRDYEDIGVQCAEMVEKILDGVSPESIRPASPRKIVYDLNLRIAQHLKLVVPEEVVKKARQVVN